METKLIYFYCNVNFENLFFKSVTIIDKDFFQGEQLKDCKSEAQKMWVFTIFKIKLFKISVLWFL